MGKATYDRHLGSGRPLKVDRDRAWRDFAGWRGDDPVLPAVATPTAALEAPCTMVRMKTDRRAPD